MSCDVYEAETRREVLVVVPAGASTTVVPESAGLGTLRPSRIAVDLSEILLDPSTMPRVAAELEKGGFLVLARSAVC
jgi:hypothetical protein